MIIGVPKEIKNNEFRVSATPSGVHALVKAGHSVLVETSAGLGSAITDADYVAAGATIISTSDEVWAKADLILKVKEPIAAEYPKLRKGQILFTYLHLAASRECTDALIKSGTTAIAFETVEVNGQLPLLAPMSEVAGRMSISWCNRATEARRRPRSSARWSAWSCTCKGCSSWWWSCWSFGSNDCTWNACRCNNPRFRFKSPALLR